MGRGCAHCQTGELRESGVAQERGSGKSETRLERVVAILAQSEGAAKKGKSVDNELVLMQLSLGPKCFFHLRGCCFSPERASVWLSPYSEASKCK